MNKILVTGGAGFVPSALVNHLAPRTPNNSVTAVDNLTTGDLLKLDLNAKLIRRSSSNAM
jgi:nucleoside-diphosphate-sugar epimerase